ncbi:uncharacterized protein V6R79_011981 [Siganus canaliculatus]
MAARWGTGEDTLTACNNMDFFPMDTLDETDVLTSGETLEALQSCLDPSILSIFEDTPIIETKGLDEESEATLLTALTEILDNVDDENLSPFDTVPDSDLLSGQKGREHSPLRRLLCLSRSPPEKDALCSARTFSNGKSLPRMPTDSAQRSDGEEEEDGSLTLSPVGHDSSPDRDMLDWEGLTLPLPVTFEPEGEDGVSVSLGDLVRHMHPYCMTICMENDEGEQMLPEGGILLEVVDKGENGEPILAIPDMDLPVSLPPQVSSSENEQKVSDDVEDAASESSEHIVVDDEDVTEAPVKAAPSVTADSSSDLKDELIIRRQKEEIKMKSPSRRKKKKKCKEQLKPKPMEGRVLRSGTNTAHQLVKKPEKRSVKEEKKQKLPTKVSPASASSTAQSKKQSSCRTETQPEITSTATSAERKVQVAPPVSPTQEVAVLNAHQEQSQPSSPATAMSPPKPEMAEQLAPAHKKLEGSSAAPPAVLPPVSSESPAAAPCPVTALPTPPVGEAPPPVVAELKPKSLSLAEYRRLRQQKKPTSVESQDNSNSTKWPSLPELPKELLPIPCLPDPSPKDPRRPNVQGVTKEEKEVRPAWQPRGPCAPPTPEALLVPPAYMVASASKASATSVPKPEKTPQASTTPPTQTPLAPPALVKDVSTNQHATAVKCVPQISTVSLKPGSDSTSTKFGVQHQPESHKSVELNRTCLKTTTEPTKPTTAATVSHPSASKRITVVFPKAPEVTAATSSENTISPDRKPPKPAASFTGADGAHPADSKNLKAKPVVLETKEKAVKPQQTKSPTQELIEAFTSEIGIEAADLNSLLEQFEETQAKEDQIVPGVSGRAAAVRNSSVESAPENSAVERVRANDLSSTAALTPPATPPHQMWKPLAAVALLGKSKAEASKSSPSKVIQIEARPLLSAKSRSRPTPPTASISPEVACMDHDYCLPNTGPGEPGKRWNVKQQSFITIKPIKPITATTQTPPAALAFLAQSTANSVVTAKTQDSPLTESMDRRTEGMERSSVLETPDASPVRQEMDVTKEEIPRRGAFGRSYRQHAASHSPSPRACSKERTGGRSRKRRSRRSPTPISSGSESDSHSSRSRSRSHSPSKKRYRACRSRSSSSSASCSSSRSSPSVSRSPPRRRRYSYSSSRSGSWSRSRSRSRTPEKRAQWSNDRRLHRPVFSTSPKPCMEKTKKYKEKAIEERRVVYVGRIRGTMTQNELKERFSLFGEIEECTLHFRDRGDNYGFVTYYSTKDAFTAIENGSKLRKPDELPFDLCFGGRRQFCQTSYADLDSSREYDPLPANGKFHALDFDTLLKQAQQSQKR